MANAQLKNILLGAACVVSAMFVAQGMKAASVLQTQKIDVQNAETEKIMRWRQSYQALTAPKEKWDQSFRKAESVADLVALTAHLKLDQYGLQTDTDNVVPQTVEPLLFAGQKIGITKICLATGMTNGGGFLVAADNYEALLSGINRLSKRLDITVGTITLQGDKAFPFAKLGDFCVLLRN